MSTDWARYDLDTRRSPLGPIPPPLEDFLEACVSDCQAKEPFVYIITRTQYPSSRQDSRESSYSSCKIAFVECFSPHDARTLKPEGTIQADGGNREWSQCWLRKPVIWKEKLEERVLHSADSTLTRVRTMINRLESIHGDETSDRIIRVQNLIILSVPEHVALQEPGAVGVEGYFESFEMLSMPFTSIQSARQKYRPNEVEERGREIVNIHKR
ncbi:hypothetical protein B0H13DRAFT_1886812 [Mycena leptocephala]|nr:hypothetical protein B0H13DRAFT_1886812 [Mycena leptocephala]